MSQIYLTSYRKKRDKKKCNNSNSSEMQLLKASKWLRLETLLGLWKVWTQESFQKVEFDRPGERSPD